MVLGISRFAAAARVRRLSPLMGSGASAALAPVNQLRLMELTKLRRDEGCVDQREHGEEEEGKRRNQDEECASLRYSPE